MLTRFDRIKNSSAIFISYSICFFTFTQTISQHQQYLKSFDPFFLSVHQSVSQLIRIISQSFILLLFQTGLMEQIEEKKRMQAMEADQIRQQEYKDRLRFEKEQARIKAVGLLGLI